MNIFENSMGRAGTISWYVHILLFFNTFIDEIKTKWIAYHSGFSQRESEENSQMRQLIRQREEHLLAHTVECILSVHSHTHCPRGRSRMEHILEYITRSQNPVSSTEDERIQIVLRSIKYIVSVNMQEVDQNIPVLYYERMNIEE